ncbi:hypothetical protein [Blastochloris viridis]|uniref:Uncharacterized protein n=1 Tax=Blastochloris viridis TaxID=1079 RepID=A0A0H5BBD9_BLAVI|nr:hypothetical protein [Blastochloris viridis]ALK10545.1 hypothetical protein BVIR_2780 [Blastochloris viridis]BAR99500.1 hypothetical protein BV133_1907 [Blastochloris viridis]CUU43207.1 hypothetical protein BVIRIDIS_22240 [Blastochloris viridis]
MNRIVRENYPVSKLPEELRPTTDLNAVVTVTIEEDTTGGEQRPDQLMTLEEIFALRRPPYLTKEEIDDDVRRDRDMWDD